mmetsp:Transcript_18139/g.36758  ORF Transcript_18139/g.36758 Transcript_18139/m.36758 type:complete len:722 (-) Transcript_18139:72-2237(-)
MFAKFKNFVRVLMAVSKQWDHHYPRTTIYTNEIRRRSGRVTSKEGTRDNTDGERIDETMSQRNNERIGSQSDAEAYEGENFLESDSSYVSDSSGSSISGATSDSSEDESRGDGNGEDEGMVIHPGFLEFLSRQRSNSIHRLNSIVQQLRGSQMHSNRRYYFGDENDNRAEAYHREIENDEFSTPSLPLSQIRLIRDHIRDEGIVRIADAMEEGCSCCPYSNQNNCCHNNDDKKLIAPTCNPKSLLWMPCSCPTRYLSEINLSMSHIGDLGACSLAHAISKACLPSLHSVDVSSNNITGIGVICLANCSLSFSGVYDKETRSNRARIQTLCLSSNKIGSLGASALANALCGYRSKCWFSSKDKEMVEKNATTLDFDDSPASIAVNGPRGFCNLKSISLSQCRLNDYDATLLGEALLPYRDDAPIQFGMNGQPPGAAWKQKTHAMETKTEHSLPSLPQSHSLENLHLYGNLITLTGMEFLHSVIHSCGLTPGFDDLQSLFSRSNHTIDIGVVIDNGMQDDHIGPFFNQEEDNELMSRIRDIYLVERLRSDASATTPPENQIAIAADKDGCNSKELQELMIKKLTLKDSIARDLAINTQCAQHVSLSRISPFQRSPFHFDNAGRISSRILGAAAREKIAHVLKDALCHNNLGKQLQIHRVDEGFEAHFCSQRVSSFSIAQIFSDADDTLFPHAISWTQRYCSSSSFAMTFEILRTNPDLCSSST